MKPSTGSTNRKRAKAAPMAPLYDHPKRPPRPHSEWYRQRQSGRIDWQMHTLHASEVGRMSFTLPAYQRDVVWSRTQQLAFVRSVWDGQPVSPVVVWERSWSEPVAVLDGQQRLTALGVPMLRADGTTNDVPRFALDVAAGEWLDADPGDRAVVRVTTPVEIAGAKGWDFVDEFDRENPENDPYDDLSEPRCAAIECLSIAQGLRIPMMVLRGPMDPSVIVQAFRTLATPGVPWTLEEIERMVGSVSDRTDVDHG
jgi:hypothetical protein